MGSERRVIWKYALLKPVNDLMLPLGWRVVSVAWQHGPTVWLWVDPDAEKFPERFDVVATGEDFDGNRSWPIGTAFAPDGTVWHVIGRPTPDFPASLR